jgi:plastocyanin
MVLRRSIVPLFLSLFSATACSGTSASLNGCTAFDDQSGTAARKIDWDLTVSTSPSRCMTVKKGQTVAFEGDFTTHPLRSQGGDTPNPFDQVADTGKVTFAAEGTFGFVCSHHANMTGAIHVIE